MKRILVFQLSAALVAGALYAVPAAAQEAPEVPEVANIEDPVEDANYLNGQFVASDQGDISTPADASGVGDILKVWFSNTKDTFSVHVQTQAPPPSSGAAYTFFLYANAEDCLFIEGTVAAPTYQGESNALIEDGCAEAEAAPGEIAVAEGPDGTGITTATFPRSYSAALADGAVIAAPRLEMNNAFGAPGSSLRFPAIDNTKRGTDYVVTSGEAAEEEPEEPKEPKKKKKDGKKKDDNKKGCKKGKKGKGKKRGCEGKGKKGPKTGPPAEACAPFTPGEAGADKPTVTLTDEATEEKPVEQTVNLGMSLANLRLLGDIPPAGPLAATVDVFNIQVDSKAAEAGVYALFEFPERRDYDMNLLHPDGSYAARARSFNTAIETPISTAGHGGEGTDHSEKLVGIKTSDCGGWTLSAENHFGEGGEFTIKLWLGEAAIDPLPPGEETP